MRIALLHDYLNQYGGAERVLEAIAELFPEAPIYTLFYNAEGTFNKFSNKKIITSFLQYIPGVAKRHRFFIPLMPLAVFFMRIKGYDMVISDSAGYAKGIRAQGAFHITYCHTPLRYAWEEKKYLDTHPMFQKKVTRFFARLIAAYLRKWDFAASKNPDVYIANSKFIASKIKKYYGREAVVIYPPVDTSVFYPEASVRREYYLASGRMLHYKRFDLVIEAFCTLQKPLMVVGMGPELAMLKKMTQSSHVQFIPYVSGEDELRRYYSGAKALLFPQVEDFGLVAAEAIACGTPVIAYRAGGAREIVEEGKSGLFFDIQSVEAIIDAVADFERRSWDNDGISKSGERFSKKRFQKEFLHILEARGFKTNATLQRVP